MNTESLAALQLLLDRATQERDRLAGDLRRCEEVARRARRQGEQLATYRSEYMQRWRDQFSRGGAIELMHCYQSFMQRLEEALGQQQRQIDAADADAAAARQLLLQAEQRVASVKKLIERRQAELQRVQDRREQRQADETAQQLSRHRLRGDMTLQH